MGFPRILASPVIFLFSEAGNILGTAFIVGYPVAKEPGMVVPLVVTAKHVVGDLQRVVGRFTTRSGCTPAMVPYDLEILRREGDLWLHNDDGVDLMVFRTLDFETTGYKPVPLDLIASKKTYEEEDIKATDRVAFPCLLVNFIGTPRNYPTIGDGSIASIPDEPVSLRYLVGHRTVVTKQEIVLIDATSIPGGQRIARLPLSGV